MEHPTPEFIACVMEAIETAAKAAEIQEECACSQARSSHHSTTE
jgi:hypothetical protein